MSTLADFHPAVSRWFACAFPTATAAQRAAWPQIRAGRHTLVAAPTGSGKTLTAFLAALDGLVRQGLRPEGLPDETVVVYVSPLKALSNDIAINLEAPLAGIRAELAALGLPDVEIRTAVRTGDTPVAERQRALRKPPHILVTTPESLYVLLGSPRSRAMLETVRAVIVDEIHAVAASKRGSHLALSLERLDALTAATAEARGEPRRLTRIGLSATQKPIDEIARFLVGVGATTNGVADCAIVDIGYAKERDLALELPPTPLAAVMSNDQWEQVHGRIAELALLHKTTLVFVNTRRMAERAARHLGERLGRDAVAAHHGSLAKEIRLDAEQRLKRGDLKLLVATASLELGLDIGDVDLVCQLGSPRSIAAFLQRAGRSGHAVGGVPKARLFPQTRDELVECAALLDCVRRGELDALRVVPAPLDVLAQQIVAETACRECDEEGLFELVRRAWPYAELPRERFDAVVRMVSEGFTTRHGQRAGHVHRDAVHGKLREKRGARMAALTSGGTIPETGDYVVLLEPQALTVGSVNEDFAVESIKGDIFQLGNTSYRILKIESGRVRVEDAQGAAPNIPFWLGEAPGRSDELSAGVVRLRQEVAERIGREGVAAARAWLADEVGLGDEAAAQLADYVGRALIALGTIPTQQRIVLERFFDTSGGMQLVIHAPFGSRVNRAWGLALRKRFCRRFNFELQAAATEDAIVLSLSTSHSFPLDEVAQYLHSATALDILVQAVLDAPLFAVRWRWNATTALALLRFSGGKKVAPQLQRMRSEDLLAAVFPDQVACAENLTGAREVPDHPLVAQTLRDCLEDAMDAPGWLRVLRAIEGGTVEVVARDLLAPSPLAAEALSARPYAFLDDAPLEERRTQAVRARRYDDPDDAGALGRLDPEAIARVRAEAWPEPRDADEMHEALDSLGAITLPEAERHEGWTRWLGELADGGRAGVLHDADGVPALWVAAERLPQWLALRPEATLRPPLAPPPEAVRWSGDRDEALREVIRSRLGALGPVALDALASPVGIAVGDVEAALLQLQTEGTVLQGRFSAEACAGGAVEWCERHLLARIHRATLGNLRREIEPVEPRDFARFLFEWQHVGGAHRVSGPEALAGVLAQLEGYEAAAAAWEGELLPARIDDYAPGWLDELCTAGRTLWTRLRPPSVDARAGAATSIRATPILLLPRRTATLWAGLAPAPAGEDRVGSRARRVAEFLATHGASFFDDIVAGTRLLRAEVEDALAELVVRGLVHGDSYAGLRALLVPPSKRAKGSGRRGRVAWFGIEDAGRWSLARSQPRPTPQPMPSSSTTESPSAPGSSLGFRSASADIARETVEHVARILLRRYGVVCWRLLEREPGWLPPWRELVRVYRRLEARGEIRGGRFVAGLAGEQYALPDAVSLLREVRRRPPERALVCVAASDPANLLGALLPGPRVARVAGARVLYRDGVPLATSVGGEVTWLADVDDDERARLRRVLDGASLATVEAGALEHPRRFEPALPRRS
ncbi:MAG TPA: DEAD/DEAH box helicase [Caldimonas sp.]|nr:DEAD/DEAH box helicase [Caldimonas sp.]HEX4235245.1 DEAD/DEAH box helicase [Caldimonas sp.]